MIRIEQAQDGFQGLFTATVFEDLDVRVIRKFALNVFGQDYRTMMRIVMTDKSTGEPNQDVRRICGGVSNGAATGKAISAQAGERKSSRRKPHRTSCTTKHGCLQHVR